MHDSNLIHLIVFVILGFVGLNALSYYSERLMIFPNVIWVLCLGIIYSALNHFGLFRLPEVYLEPEIVLFLLVPILIFATVKKMCLHDFRRVLKGASILATLGISISMVGVAFSLNWIFHVPLLTSFLFGVIISATDPIAVTALLDDSEDISQDVKMLIKGESILNDGFVVAVSSSIAALAFDSEKFSFILSSGTLIAKIVGALLLGAVLGRIARLLLHIWKSNTPPLTVNITLAAAFASFLLAETLHLPGVLAVFGAALAFGYRPDERNKKVQYAQGQVWEYLEYIANVVIFFLLGSSFFAQASLKIITIQLVIFCVIMLFVSRFVALIVLKPLLSIEGGKVTHQDFWLLNFSGSRGAISIALILLLPNDFIYKPLFLTISFVIVIMSLILYPMIFKKILEH